MSSTFRPLHRDDPESTYSSTPSRSSSVAGVAEGFQLGRPEQWMLDTVRRYSTAGFVGAMTLLIAVGSLTITWLIFLLLFGLDDEALVLGMVLSMALPIVLAPPVLILAVRLMSRLDIAGELLRVAALTDPLTGVLNRRGLLEVIDELSPKDLPVEVAMVDVDKFKQLNDAYGHAMGDLVLPKVAEWLGGLVGDSGVVSRTGGDEFVLVVSSPQSPKLPNRQDMVMDGVAFSVTIGVAEFAGGEEFSAALARADADLYERKRGTPKAGV